MDGEEERIMKFSLTRPVKIVMLGAGGTGAYAAPFLYRLIHTMDRPVRFIICDGDTVERKNLVRQNFTEGDLAQNKAKVLAERYSNVFGLETEYVSQFVESEDLLKQLIQPESYQIRGCHYDEEVGNYVQNSLEEIVILLGCVDNNKSRQLCHQVFLQAKELIYIDSGNGEYSGQIVCGIRRGGRTYYPPIGQVHPEVFEDEDLFPSELSCADAAVSAPQTIVANLTAATSIVNLVYNILILGDNTVRQTLFNTKNLYVRPTIQKSKRRRAA